MKIKNKTAIAFLIVSSILLLGVLAIMDFRGAIKGPQCKNIYTFGSDKTTIIKYDADNSRRTIILEGNRREEIVGILGLASYNTKYRVEQSDFQYIVNFRNGYIGYIDMNEKMFKFGDCYHELTQDQCNKIDSLFSYKS